jgi:hypothetical protein
LSRAGNDARECEEVPLRGRRPGLFGSLFVIGFGLIFITAGHFVHQQRSPYADGVSAAGTVTGVKQAQDRDGTTMYAAVVTFTTQDNRSVSVAESSTSGTRPEVGKAVHVSYRAVDPEGARIIPDHDWISLACYTGGGLVALLGLAHFLLRLLAATMVGVALYKGWKMRRAWMRQSQS